MIIRGETNHLPQRYENVQRLYDHGRLKKKNRTIEDRSRLRSNKAPCGDFLLIKLCFSCSKLWLAIKGQYFIHSANKLMYNAVLLSRLNFINSFYATPLFGV